MGGAFICVYMGPISNSAYGPIEPWAGSESDCGRSIIKLFKSLSVAICHSHNRDLTTEKSRISRNCPF